MSAAIPRPPGPSTTWWIFAPTPAGPCAVISLTWGRQVRSFAGSVKNANTSSGDRLIVIVRSACGIRLSSGWGVEHGLLGARRELRGDHEATERGDALESQLGRVIGPIFGRAGIRDAARDHDDVVDHPPGLGHDDLAAAEDRPHSEGRAVRVERRLPEIHSAAAEPAVHGAAPEAPGVAAEGELV